MPELPIALLPVGNRAGTASSEPAEVQQDSAMTTEVAASAPQGDAAHTTSGRRGHRVQLLTIVLVATAVFLLVEVVAHLHPIPPRRALLLAE
jgi:hypothetical protein